MLLTHLLRFFFFFQAEDGIRDLTVTGVQTCALPISKRVVDWCGTYQAGTTTRFVPGTLYMGGTYTSDSAGQARGWLTALDAARGTVRWRYRSPRPMVAGVTATAGGRGFTGELAGGFPPLEAPTGRGS